MTRSPSSPVAASSAEAVAARAPDAVVASMPRARRFAFALAPSLVLAVCLGVAEAGLRALAPIESLEVFVQSRWQRDDFEDRHAVRIFEGDPILFWRLKPNLHRVVWDFTLVSTNPQGLRWDRPLRHKPRDGLRIVCMGDSVTFGYRVPLAWPDGSEPTGVEARPFTSLMEARLEASDPDRHVEVIPLAVPGYTSRQGRAWLERTIAELGADVIVLQYGWNDVSLREQPDRVSMRDGALHRLARAVASRSQIALHLVAWWQRPGGDDATKAASEPQPRISREEYVANLLAMARLATSHGATPLILGPIYRDSVSDPAAATRVREYRAAIRTQARAAGFEYLDIAELTERGFPSNNRVFGEAIHPNAAGHALLAESILNHLEIRSLLPRATMPSSRAADPRRRPKS